MVKVEKGIWALVLVVFLAACLTMVLGQVSPALRTYCLRVEDASQADIWSDCVVFDVTGTRMCLDKNCDCDCDDSGEGWISQDDCSTSSAVAVFDSSLEQFFCSGNLTFSSNTLSITRGNAAQLQLINNGTTKCSLNANVSGNLEATCSGDTITATEKVDIETTDTPQLTLGDGLGASCTSSVNGSGVLTQDCSGDSVIFSDPVTFSSGVSGVACEDTQAGVIQFSDGSNNLTCDDSLYKLAGTNLYLHDQSAAPNDDKEILISVSASTGGTGDDKGTGYIGFTDATPAAPTELVNTLDFKSEGVLHFEPCCTTADFGADCKYPQSACVLAADGMEVVGELRVKSDLVVASDIYYGGTLIHTSPLDFTGPVYLYDSAGHTVKTALTTSSTGGGDYTIAPDGGDTDITGTLTVSSDFTTNGEYLSEAAATATSHVFNNDTTKTTGDNIEVQDNGTWVFRWNANGHMQAADDKRLFLANGNDDSTYNTGWGLLTIDHSITGSSSETIPAARWRLKDQQTTGGTTNARNLWLATEFAPGGNTVTGHTMVGIYNQVATSDAGTTGGSTTLIGLQNLVQAASSGTTSIPSMEGQRLQMQFGGTNKTIATNSGLLVKTPQAPGSGTTVTTSAALNIEDQGGYATFTHVLLASSQTTDNANEGNITMAGGAYNTGHFVAENGHLWYDGTNEAWRLSKDLDGSAPTSNTDGMPLPLAYCEINAEDNTTVTTISASSTPVQIVIFDTNGPSNIDTPDHTNDHCTIAEAGTYMVQSSVTMEGVSLGAAADAQITIEKNNGATQVGACKVRRNLAGGSGDYGSLSISCLASLSASDTIEAWISNETNTSNFTVRNITLSMFRIN